MIWVPISCSSRGSIAFTLPRVPTDMKTGVSTTPCGVVNRPRRALLDASVLSSSNMAARVNYHARPGNWKVAARRIWNSGTWESQTAKRGAEFSRALSQHRFRAFRMRHHFGAWMFRLRLRHPPRRERGMHDTSALPDLHVLPPGLLLHVVAQVAVGQE